MAEESEGIVLDGNDTPEPEPVNDTPEWAKGIKNQSLVRDTLEETLAEVEKSRQQLETKMSQTRPVSQSDISIPDEPTFDFDVTDMVKTFQKDGKLHHKQYDALQKKHNLPRDMVDSIMADRVRIAQMEGERIYQTVTEIAGGKDEWDAIRSSFHSIVPEDRRDAIQKGLQSSETAKWAMMELMEFHRKSTGDGGTRIATGEGGPSPSFKDHDEYLNFLEDYKAAIRQRRRRSGFSHI